MALQTTDLRYPIGRFSPADPVTRDQVDAWIGDIAALPADLRRTVAALTDEQLNTSYARTAGRFGRSSTIWPTAT